MRYNHPHESVNVLLAKPSKLIREGDHLRIAFEDGGVIQVEIDDEAKARAQARIQAKLDRLRLGEHLRD